MRWLLFSLLGIAFAGTATKFPDGIISKNSVSVNISGTAADSKALLDVSSTVKGVLIPRMTTTQRDNIASPTTGLLLYNSTTGYFSVYNGSSWLQMASLAGTEALTNKTIAAGSNTISGLTNTNLSGSAAVSNANLASVSTATFKGRTTAGSGVPEDLTATQATALLNAVVGDSGSGGTKGLVPAPASGDTAAGKFLKADGSWQSPGGGGGGGGGGAEWQPTAGLSPTVDYEFDEKVWEFQKSQLQSLTLWVKVPNSYSAASAITLKGGFYSTASSNKFKFQIVATLVRAGTDAIDSTTNQNTVNSGDITNSVAKQLRTLSFSVASAGTVNAVSVSAGDILKLQLSRIASAATEDTTDIRFIPSSTEVLFQ